MIVNLTPHPINVYSEDTPDNIDPTEHSPEWSLPISNRYAVARIRENIKGRDNLVFITLKGNNITIPIYKIAYGEVEDAPPYRYNVWYVVSLATALAVRRSDFLIPYKEVRNMAGTVIGCRALGQAEI